MYKANQDEKSKIEDKSSGKNVFRMMQQEIDRMIFDEMMTKDRENRAPVGCGLFPNAFVATTY